MIKEPEPKLHLRIADLPGKELTTIFVDFCSVPLHRMRYKPGGYMKARVAVAAACAVVIFSMSLQAHHGYADFKQDKVISVQGTLERVDWAIRTPL